LISYENVYAEKRILQDTKKLPMLFRLLKHFPQSMAEYKID